MKCPKCGDRLPVINSHPMTLDGQQATVRTLACARCVLTVRTIEKVAMVAHRNVNKATRSN